MIKFRALVVCGLLLSECLGMPRTDPTPLPLEEYGTPDPAAPRPAPTPAPPYQPSEMRPL